MTDIALRDLAPDIILTGGRVVTMDTDMPEATAVAVKDGHILAVGSDSAIEGLAGPGTRRVDLGGRLTIPGIIDTHNHLVSTGTVLNEIGLYSARSIAEIQELVAERVRTAPPGAWILGRGWDESLLSDKRFPNRHDLDEVAPNNPVVLDRVWNMLLANTAALQAADIGRDTPDPPADALYAGRIERDERGDPTGIFRDRAKEMIKRAVPTRTQSDIEHSIRTACQAFNEHGITSVCDPGLFPDEIRAYYNVLGSDALTVRVGMCIGGWGFGNSEEEATIEQRVISTGVASGFGEPLLKFDTVKFMPDGGVGDRTALMFDAYAGEPGNFGQFVFPERDLFEHVAWCHDLGWSVDCHACGDRMIELVAKAYAAAYDKRPDSRMRHRLHHAYLPTPTALELMREYRIPALPTIPFLTNLGESFVTSLGEERASTIMPLRSYMEAGVQIALSSDSPVTTFNPFVGFYSAVTRKTVYGRTLGEDERISREDALRLYTLDAARVTAEDDIKGSLTPGKLADIAVLDRDILTVDENDLAGARAALTLIGGRIVVDRLSGTD